jgi:[pyruvate, water dikinase]-phosphate phosphotransferase / [pyruvate, water dikinase] kinase
VQHLGGFADIANSLTWGDSQPRRDSQILSLLFTVCGLGHHHVDRVLVGGWTNHLAAGMKTGLSFCPLIYPQATHNAVGMSDRIHLHLLSDSTGETLENLAKAALAQFDEVEVVKHFWPMVRSESHLDRILIDIAAHPGLVLFTLVSGTMRAKLEERCRILGLPAVAALDAVTDAFSAILGREAKARPGRQHALDAAYFARVEAIHFTIAHDDGVNHQNWEEADIVLAGVSRTSKTPTSIYLANRGYKTANIPLVPESPPPLALYTLRNPLVVGLVTSADRLIQVRRNRLLSLNQAPDTDYVNEEKIKAEIAFARRMFGDNGWPVIDVTRRSIEESAAAIINLYNERQNSDSKATASEAL